MPERIDKLEGAIITLTDKFSEFLAVESARQERDKHQVDINERLIKHMEEIDSQYKPILARSKKYQDWMDSFIGKFILPGIILAILAAAGYNFS